jgi:hypothetical protein
MAAGKGTHGLNCDAALIDTARTVLEARFDELTKTRSTVSGPDDSDALHQLRISSKRLRYSFEMFTVCFPPKVAQERADEVRGMQDVLGRIHDLDVLHTLLQDQIARIEMEAREDAMRVALTPADGSQRDDELLGRSRADGKADGRLGLYKVIAAKADERRQLYARFVDLWTQWEETGFLTTVQESLTRPHSVTGAVLANT